MQPPFCCCCPTGLPAQPAPCRPSCAAHPPKHLAWAPAGPTGGVLARNRLLAIQLAASEASTFRMQSARSQDSAAGLVVEGWEEAGKAKGETAQDGGAERVRRGGQPRAALQRRRQRAPKRSLQEGGLCYKTIGCA